MIELIKDYETPEIEIMEVYVEKGFEGSNQGTIDGGDDDEL